MKINVGISETDRRSVSEQLTKLLADEYVLYTKTRNAHCNTTFEIFKTKKASDFHRRLLSRTPGRAKVEPFREGFD